ncbi:MAG: type 1 glutamine amidotransferase [Anaerolineae bacterium]|nr:type 1 glutamine amidotransferase [Anaerolineae bacterium]
MRLNGKKIAIFVEDLFEDLEFWYPYYRLKEEGASITAIGPKARSYTGKHGVPATADVGIDEVNAKEFDALVIPGGYSPDKMRRTPAMVEFVKQSHLAGKLVASICHGPWMLASAEIINDTKLTSFFSIKDDMIHAGADWVDEEAVFDNNIITSRNPDDLPAFCQKIIVALG